MESRGAFSSLSLSPLALLGGLLALLLLLLQSCVATGQQPAPPATSIRLPIFQICPNASACVWAVNVTLGTPGQERMLVANNFQQLTWTFSSSANASDLLGMSPVFDPSNSSSLKYIDCSDQVCFNVAASQASNPETPTPAPSCSAGDSCSFDVDLLVGDVKGKVAADMVGFGNMTNLSGAGPIGLATEFNFSAMAANSFLDGDLSLSLANTSFFSSISKSLNLPKIMSICRGDKGRGVLSIGQLPDAIAKSVQYAAMYKGDGRYSATANHIQFGNTAQDEELEVAFSTSFDTSFIPTDGFDAFITEISQNTSLTPKFSGDIAPGHNVTVFYSPSCQQVKFPDVLLTLGNVTVTIAGDDYTSTMPADAQGGCPILLKAFRSFPPFEDVFITGVPKNTWMVVDADQSKIGFLQNQSCV